AVRPDPEEVVVDVLRLDRRDPDPLDSRLVEDPADEAGEGQRRSGVGAAEAALGPAAVVRPDVDPGQDDLPMTDGEGPPDVGEDGLGGEAPFRPARGRDDAVGAEERAAVLDLDEGPGPLDRRPAVGDPLDLDAGEGRQWPSEGSAIDPSLGRPPDEGVDLGEEGVLRAIVDEAGGRIDRRERLASDLDGAARDDEPGGGA